MEGASGKELFCYHFSLQSLWNESSSHTPHKSSFRSSLGKVMGSELLVPFYNCKSLIKEGTRKHLKCQPQQTSDFTTGENKV